MRQQLPWAANVYAGIAVAMLVAFAATVVLSAVDARTIDGETSVWAKPLKFELSLAIHAATLALVTRRLAPSSPRDALLRAVALAFLAATVIEIGYIVLQAARAEHSHFNVSTPFHRRMYTVMAIGAVVITAAAAATGLAVAFDGKYAAAAPVRIAVVLGLVGGTVLTLATAFTIGSRMSPYVGAVPAPGTRMLLTGWSRTGGDLRVPHFLATHTMQALPLLGLACARLLPGRAALGVVLVGAAAALSLTLLEYQTARSGAPSRLAYLLG